MSKRWPRPVSYRPTPEMQAERDRNQADQSSRVSPAARYWPTRIRVEAPRLDDGKIDVRAWLAQLDDHCNEGIVR